MLYCCIVVLAKNSASHPISRYTSLLAYTCKTPRGACIPVHTYIPICVPKSFNIRTIRVQIFSGFDIYHTLIRYHSGLSINIEKVFKSASESTSIFTVVDVSFRIGQIVQTSNKNARRFQIYYIIVKRPFPSHRLGGNVRCE